jgi:hypothetical protein
MEPFKLGTTLKLRGTSTKFKRLHTMSLKIAQLAVQTTRT